MPTQDNDLASGHMLIMNAEIKFLVSPWACISCAVFGPALETRGLVCLSEAGRGPIAAIRCRGVSRCQYAMCCNQMGVIHTALKMSPPSGCSCQDWQLFKRFGWSVGRNHLSSMLMSPFAGRDAESRTHPA